MSTTVLTTAPIDAGADTARPEAGDFVACQRIFGLSESTVRRLDAVGEVTIIRLRMRGSKKTGKALVNFDSVRAYLRRCEEMSRAEIEERVRAENSRGGGRE